MQQTRILELSNNTWKVSKKILEKVNAKKESKRWETKKIVRSKNNIQLLRLEFKEDTFLHINYIQIPKPMFWVCYACLCYGFPLFSGIFAFITTHEENNITFKLFCLQFIQWQIMNCSETNAIHICQPFYHVYQGLRNA